MHPLNINITTTKYIDMNWSLPKEKDSSGTHLLRQLCPPALKHLFFFSRLFYPKFSLLLSSSCAIALAISAREMDGSKWLNSTLRTVTNQERFQCPDPTVPQKEQQPLEFLPQLGPLLLSWLRSEGPSCCLQKPRKVVNAYPSRTLA